MLIQGRSSESGTRSRSPPRLCAWPSGGDYGTQDAAGLGVDKEGNIYIAGNTNYGGINGVTKSAFQRTFKGTNDGFIAKIARQAETKTKLKVTVSTGKTGEVLTLTATVSGPAFSPTPTGTITFDSGSKELGAASLDSSGIATLKISNPRAGTHSFEAKYEGDEYNLASTSAVVITTVKTTSEGSADFAASAATAKFTVE
jgi:hypothetical protein